MRAPQSTKFTNISATTAAFNLYGGRYVLAAAATWGGGSATVSIDRGDGTFIATGLTLSADGITTAQELPPGSYKLTIATATGLTGHLSRIPGE